MDEVDNIIIHSLIQIGCDVENLKISDFTPEILFKAVVKCINLIDSTLDIPQSLPPGMAQRFTATASLAKCFIALGYRSDIGYQTFLYSNIADIRKVFMFLIEKLPKEIEKVNISEKLDDFSLLENKIIENLRLQQQKPWMPEFCNVDNLSHTLTVDSNKYFYGKYLYIPDTTNDSICSERLVYWKEYSPSIFEQNSNNYLISSLIHSNDVNTINISKDNEIKKSIEKSRKSSKVVSAIESPHKVAVKFTPTEENTDISEYEENQNVIKRNLKPISITEKINLELDQLKNEIVNLEINNKLLESSFDNLNNQKAKENKIMIALKSDKKTNEKINILLENPDESIEKIQSIILTTNERIKTIKKQWDEHQTNLNAELQEAKSLHSKEYEYLNDIKNQMTEAQTKSQECKEDLLRKQKYYANLVEEFGKVNKKISRHSYTSRILEIIGNIKKQKLSIDKILVDTKYLQKEINTLNGQLSRQFTVTDDLIYKTAKRNENSRKAYKLLVTLHSDCEELIKHVQEIGIIMRELRDLDDQVETIKLRNVAANLARISTDILQMQNDSKTCEEKIIANKQN